jgi:type II secretory pathway pseudopilin PulG
VELLIAMAIIMTIAAIAIPNMMAAVNFARIGRAVGDIHTLEDEITLYDVINGQLPDDLSQVGYGGFLDPWQTPLPVFEPLHHEGQRQGQKR